MSEQRFDIIFRGDIVLGHSLNDVKQRLAKLFKVDAVKIDALFTGAAVPLKRNLDGAAAEKYRAVLVKAGAQVEVSAQADTGGEAVQKPVRESTLVESRTSAGGRLCLAPVGTDVLTAEERAPHIVNEVNTDNLSLRPAVGDLLDAAEKPVVAAVAVDVSELALAPVGSDLGQSRPAEPAPAPDTSGLSLADD